MPILTTSKSNEDIDDANSDGKFHRLIAVGYEEGKGPKLPEIFKLKEVYPGEPPFMKLRKFPAVLRFRKLKQEKEPDNYWFSEAMLYIPHESEEDLVNKIHQAKLGGPETWSDFVKNIQYVKNQVMEYLEDTEEARLMASEMMINNASTGEYMDPEGEQELEDNRQDTFETLQEFEHLDPEYVEKPAEDIFEKQFRPITTRPLHELSKEARKLDFFQRRVLNIGIKHARAVVKSRSGKNPMPIAPLLMIDGAAGSGKSSTINILKEFLQAILMRSGDNPECPHVLICAPTGMINISIISSCLCFNCRYCSCKY